MNDNRYCLLTSGVPAAIAVIEFRGGNAADWIRQHWRSSAARRSLEANPSVSFHEPGRNELQQDSIRFGLFTSSSLSPAGESISGEAVILCRTGLDSYELHCHGGAAAANIVVQCLEACGFKQDRRLGFGNSGIDSAVETAALQDLQRAVSVETAAILMDQYRGALTTAIHGAIHSIKHNDTSGAQLRLREIVRWTDLGCHLIKPWKIVLAGPPNAGKSSLLNAILGYKRAIVHEQAGTTRDLLVEHTSLGGWPVLMIDSAGVRDTQDRIEGAGIEASFDAVRSADCLLLLVSPDHGWQPEHDTILGVFRGERVLIVETKADVGIVDSLRAGYPRLATSVSDPGSIAKLLGTVEKLLVPEIPAIGTPIPFRPEQVESFDLAMRFLSDGQAQESIRLLESVLSGPNSSESVG